MSTPNWASAVPGGTAMAGHVNQFLTSHKSALVYAGTTQESSTATGASSTTLYNQQVAQTFTTASNQTSVSRVVLTLVNNLLGNDIVVSIQGQVIQGSNFIPNGTIYGQTIVPAEFVQNSNTVLSVPLNATGLSNSTNYYLVLGPVNGTLLQNSASVDYMSVVRSTAASGVVTLATGQSTWAAQTYGLYFNCYTGNTGALTHTYDDSGNRWTYLGYNTNNQLNAVYEYTLDETQVSANLLARNQASLEANSTSGWTGTNTTLAASNTFALDGTFSLRFTATGTSTQSAETITGTGAVPVTVGNTYTALASFRTAATSRSCTVGIQWFDSGGTSLSTSTGTGVADNTTGWTQSAVTATAPASAAFAAVILTIPSTVSNEVHYADQMGLFQSSQSAWSYPGAGVASIRNATYTSSILTAWT